MLDYLIVLGAALGTAGVAFLGVSFGWPFIIGFAVGAFCGYWNRDLIEREDQQKG